MTRKFRLTKLYIPRALRAAAIFTLAGFSLPLAAQVLAPHAPLRILIVSDEVNPHGLPPEELTQPGEISAALGALPGLRLDNGAEALLEVGTDELEQATARLSIPANDPAAYDLLIYFAHRVPNGSDGQTRQEAFVSAVDQFLVEGGSVISFHHGIYRTSGKESMQELLGGEATGAVFWNTTDGQRVISVATGHFVSSYAVSYADTVAYQEPELGIPAADYPVFDNVPDERYPAFSLLPTTGEVEALFTSNYDGQNHLLGYQLERSEWAGAVLVYQPGEYQPHALEPGNNFQILLNAIVYAATFSSGELIFGDGFESGDTSLWTEDLGSL